jgi:uncharacterized protein (DUF433 family)
MASSNSRLIVTIDPQILGGTPVFVGTREQAVAALEMAREALVADAHPA